MIRFFYLVLFLVSLSHKIYSYDVYHTSKVYGMIGSGTVWLTGGLGFSYTPEIKIKKEDKLYQAVTVDAQFLGIMNPSAFEFNLLGTYGIGYKFDKGHKLLVDIIGIGLNLRSGGYVTIGNNITYIPPAGFVFNLPGFQFTHKNNFYFAWRNNFSVGDFTEFKSYFSIGYDFTDFYYK